MEDLEEETWENLDISELLISVENKERERRLLEQRKLVEEADAELAEELFSKEKKELLTVHPQNTFKPIIKKDKPTELLEKRQKELKDKQMEESKKRKEDKEYKMRLQEIYGEAEEDIYDNMVDKYLCKKRT
jgi:hypothetical protein